MKFGVVLIINQNKKILLFVIKKKRVCVNFNFLIITILTLKYFIVCIILSFFRKILFPSRQLLTFIISINRVHETVKGKLFEVRVRKRTPSVQVVEVILKKCRYTPKISRESPTAINAFITMSQQFMFRRCCCLRPTFTSVTLDFDFDFSHS